MEVQEAFITRELDTIAVKGKAADIRVFELVGAREVFEELDEDGSGDLDKDEVRLASWLSGAVRLILTVVCVCVRSSKRCASS